VNRLPNVVSLEMPRAGREVVSVPGSSDAERSRLSWTLLIGFTALLCAGPLAFGAVEDWSIFGLEAGIALLLGLWALTQASGDRIAVLRSPVFWPATAFALLVAAQLAFHASVYPYATKYELLEYLAYTGALFLAVQCLHRERLRIFALTMTVFGFLIAVEAIAQEFSADGKLYWLRTPSHGGWVFGPYVNHNHYAGLMEMLIPFAIVLSMPAMLRQGWRLMAIFAAIIMIASLYLARSRGGIAGFVVELALLAFYLGPKLRLKQRGLWLLGTVLVLATALVLWLGADLMLARVLSTRGDVELDLVTGRLRILHDSWPMFLQKPLLGWGLGCFPISFPPFKTFYTDKFVNQAHNEYLQVLIETGLVGFGIMLWALVALFRRARALWRREFDRYSALRVAALAGLAALLVHNLVDFNLHIPANAALFFTLCGIVTGSSQTKVLPLSPKPNPFVP
jgi:O-antigen ligase